MLELLGLLELAAYCSIYRIGKDWKDWQGLARKGEISIIKKCWQEGVDWVWNLRIGRIGKDGKDLRIGRIRLEMLAGRTGLDWNLRTELEGLVD